MLELGWRDLTVAAGDDKDDVLVVSLLESVLSSYSICVRGVVAAGELRSAPLARHLVVVVGSSAVGDAVARLRRRAPDAAAGLAGVLVAAAPRREHRPALLGRLPAPLYFLPSQPASIGQLEKEWQEMQSVTIPRLPSNDWFIRHAMNRLSCRLFNFTAAETRRGHRRPICRDFE